MAIDNRDADDDVLDAVRRSLRRYEARHPHARIDAYRLDSASIRVRITDPDFEGLDRARRHDDVWRLLDELPEDVLSHLSRLLLLTPKEEKTSIASFEFDNPIPSTP